MVGNWSAWGSTPRRWPGRMPRRISPLWFQGWLQRRPTPRGPSLEAIVRVVKTPRFHWDWLLLRWSRSRRRRRRRGVGVQLGDQFDIEDQVGFGGDRAASRCPVGQLPGNEETALAANAHSIEALIPAGDDAMPALDEFKGLAAI